MNIPERMGGAVLTGHGGPEMLEWRDDIPTPAPGPGEVLVKVLAAGVNNTDVNTRVGWYADDGDGGYAGALDFPLIQGGDLCGEVARLGEGVEIVAVGDRVTCPTNQPVPVAEAPTRYRVIGSDYDGAFAEYCVVPADQLFDVGASPLSDIEIAAAPCAFGAALNMLSRAGVSSWENVLVTGASGGVGLAAVQLARYLGANPTGIASAGGRVAVMQAGAMLVLDRDEAPRPAGYDVVIDVVGGPGFADRLKALKPGGRYAVSGAVAGAVVSADLRDVYLNDLTILGCTFTPAEVFGHLVSILNQGDVRPLIAATFPMREIAAAQAAFADHAAPGKIVLTPEGDGA